MMTKMKHHVAKLISSLLKAEFKPDFKSNLKTSSDLAFGNEGANMLKDKELKAKQKEVHQIEADFSKSQKEIMKAKLALTDSEADKLARDLAKN